MRVISIRQQLLLILLLLFAVPLLIGFIVIFGWHTNNITFIQISPDFVPMQYNTALSFIASGFATSVYIVKKHMEPEWITAAKLAALWASGVALLTLLEYLLGVNFGIDQLFMGHYITTATSHPGRMAPNTALCFMLTGAVVICALRSKPNPTIVGAGGAIILGLSIISLTGYAFELEAAYGWGKLTKMAVHTGTCFLLLGAGIVIENWRRPRGKLDFLHLSSFVAIPLSLTTATFSISLWYALITTYPDAKAPYFILVFGCFFAITLYLVVNFAVSAQVERRKVKKELGTRILAEKALIIAKKKADDANRAKTNFFNNMSHDLRTPLNAIMGFSEAMMLRLHGTVGSDKNSEYVEDIHRSGKYLLGLVNNILDISRLEAGKATLEREPLDLRMVALECHRLLDKLAEDKSIKCRLEVPVVLPELNADKLSLMKIMMNVASNAIKFTEADGTVTIGANVSGDYHIIKISDNGIGISLEDLKTITEPFNQGNIDPRHSGSGGTGLGLSIAKSLTELHGGELNIESKLGVGTTITITLPSAA